MAIRLFSSPRLKEREEGLKLLSELFSDKNNVRIIHYGGEGWDNYKTTSHRIASISIKHFRYKEITTFSIYNEAKLAKIDPSNITDEQYDKLERSMLKSYFDFVKNHLSNKWVHWNMRSAMFGFEAIEKRYKVLGGNPIIIPSHNRFDITFLLSKLYTSNYEVAGGEGKLINLSRRNNLIDNYVVHGSKEVEYFSQKEFLKIEWSNIKKTEAINDILELIDKDDLIVNSSKGEIYGISPKGIIEIINSTWWLFVLWSIILYVLGAATEPIVQRLFHTSDADNTPKIEMQEPKHKK